MSAVVALLAAAPSPSPSDVELTAPGGGSPGFIGFVVTFLLAVAAIGLFLSLTKQLRVVDRRAKQLGLDDDGTGGDPAGGGAGDAADAPDASDRPDGPGAAGGGR
ncbi:hypothetical protein GXP71_01095 [Cellulomonas sp. H30R-01]|uniref:hypothetical protein n=1 Tax=Cellulomonas sp. H30R-01 TaxID=2704467 RepID=UPI00138D66EF|nr:hypothetical protein [Cellulomonas sp. H30R-01]QHT54830.1 hypothetical protein GXP71_01095 [Cellulomonas sp. H30R-01]